MRSHLGDDRGVAVEVRLATTQQVREHELEPGVPRLGIRDQKSVSPGHRRVSVDDRQQPHVALMPQARKCDRTCPASHRVRLASCQPRRRPASPRALPRLSRAALGRGRGLKRDAAVAVATGFAIQAVLILTGTLVARMLGPDGRGYLAALILWPWVITLFGNLGIPSALTYSIARDPSASRTLARWASGLRASPGAAPDRAPGPVAAVDPARRPCPGTRRPDG